MVNVYTFDPTSNNREDLQLWTRVTREAGLRFFDWTRKLPYHQTKAWSDFWQFLTEESELKDLFPPPEVTCTHTLSNKHTHTHNIHIHTHTLPLFPHGWAHTHAHAISLSPSCEQGEEFHYLTMEVVKRRLFNFLRMKCTHFQRFRHQELKLRARSPYSESDFARSLLFPIRYLDAMHTLFLIRIRRDDHVGDKVHTQTQKHTHTHTHTHTQQTTHTGSVVARALLRTQGLVRLIRRSAGKNQR